MKVQATPEEKEAKSNFDHALGTYLRDARLKSEISQAEITKVAGLSSSQFVSNIERGECAVPPYLLRIMIQEYGINMKEFLEFLVDAKMAYYKKVLASGPKKRKLSRSR